MDCPKSSYLPEDEQETLRTLVRYRRTLIQDGKRFIRRMQKALELMNIKVHAVIRDLTGKTGMAIVEAIIGGEQNPENLLAHVDRCIRADHPTILKSLQGTWRQEQLFLLKECYHSYQYYKERIAVCDGEIERQLVHYQQETLPETVVDKQQPSTKRANKNKPAFNTCSYLKAIHGVDVMAIYGISDISALEILSETGTDRSKWPSAKHFVSWLNLCPNNNISGGKLLSSMLLKKLPRPFGWQPMPFKEALAGWVITSAG